MEIVDCQFCEKKIEGYTKKHVDYLLKQHTLSKHPDKIQIGINKTDNF